MGSDGPRVFIINPSRNGRSWEIDGAHGPDDDLTSTLAILKRIGVRLPVLKLTITDDPRVGGAWPTIEDLTLEFIAVAPASALECFDLLGPDAAGEQERADDHGLGR